MVWFHSIEDEQTRRTGNLTNMNLHNLLVYSQIRKAQEINMQILTVIKKSTYLTNVLFILFLFI